MENLPKINVKKAEDYKTIIVNGVFGGHRPGFFEVIVYTDELVADDVLGSHQPDPKKIQIDRTIQCRLILDPLQAKSFVTWLSQHIKQYEEMFGEIKLEKKEEGQTQTTMFV